MKKNQALLLGSHQHSAGRSPSHFNPRRCHILQDASFYLELPQFVLNSCMLWANLTGVHATGLTRLKQRPLPWGGCDLCPMHGQTPRISNLWPCLVPLLLLHMTCPQPTAQVHTRAHTRAHPRTHVLIHMHVLTHTCLHTHVLLSCPL